MTDFAPTIAPESPIKAGSWVGAMSGGRGRLSWYFSLGWISLIAFLAVFADFLPFVKSYSDRFPGAFKKAPSMDHWFGTNKISQDIFSRTVYGARISLLIAATSIVVGLLVAGGLGMVAGYYRGRVDALISSGVDVLLAFPPLVLTLAITTFESRTAAWVIVSLTILSIPPLTRVVRANTIVYAQREFVTAARSLGATDRRILIREILPNVVPAMVSFALTGMAVLIVAEGALSYLGQSVQPPLPTWGFLIADGSKNLRDAWWISMLPSIVMFLTILSFNMIGDHLSRRFDIKESLA
jgi:peptide/nickel transport system permease protein